MLTAVPNPADRTPPARWIIVSPEMTLIIGPADLADAALPDDPLWISFRMGGEPADVRMMTAPAEGGAGLLVLAVARAAILRLGGRAPIGQDARGYHLPTELRAIAHAIRDCAEPGEAGDVYCVAKSLELLCETIRLQRAAALVPVAPSGGLSFADTRRLIEVRRMIDERWQEKLTLATIGRACGLNRAKLTRGFRELFACTIAEALAERRLDHARSMLVTTDLPISSIGYENGYLNNASFARAFGRRFGVSPSDYRACRVAA
jgi:AraC family transcriptional activator of pyochelin receptor